MRGVGHPGEASVVITFASVADPNSALISPTSFSRGRVGR